MKIKEKKSSETFTTVFSTLQVSTKKKKTYKMTIANFQFRKQKIFSNGKVEKKDGKIKK